MLSSIFVILLTILMIFIMTKEDAETNGVSSYSEYIKSIGVGGVLAMILPGLVVGVCVYLAKLPIFVWTAWEWLFAAILLAEIIGFVIFAVRKAETPAENLLALAIAVIIAIFALRVPLERIYFQSIFMSTLMPMRFVWLVALLAGLFIIFNLCTCREEDDEDAAWAVGKWMAVVAILAIMVLIFPWKSLTAGSPQQGIPEVTAPPQPQVVEDDVMRAVQDNLTIQRLTVEELEALTAAKYNGISDLLLYSSLSTTDKERTEQTGFSDALTFGFIAEEKESKFLEVEEEILRNPVYGVTVANALRDKRVGNRTLGELNPWLNEFVQKNENGVFYWLEHRNGEDTIYVTSEYRTYAATLCTLLERMTNEGVQTKQTRENWCLSLTAENNSRKGVKADYQYQKDALILEVKGKNGATFLTVGFNVHDKRPEFFDDEVPVVTPVPTYVPASPKPPVTPTPVPDVTPTPTPVPVVTPTPTPVVTPTPTPVVTPTPTPVVTPTPTPIVTPTPTVKPTPTPTPVPKDPAKDPVNNGNADKGGGDNKPTDGAGDYQSIDPRTETSTGSENNNNQGYSDPATVVPTTPPVVPSHTAEPIVDHEEPMDYEPDPVTGRGPVDGLTPTTTSGDGEFIPDD